MKRIVVLAPESTVKSIDEIRAALEKAEGADPGMSRVIRLAVATMRKRMSDEGLLGAE